MIFLYRKNMMEAYEHFKIMKDFTNSQYTCDMARYIPIDNCLVDYITMFGERNEVVICCYAKNRIKSDNEYVIFSKHDSNEPYSLFLEIYVHQNVVSNDLQRGGGWKKQLLSATIRNNYTPYNR
jgi:hypothetical protein